ncbi:MAG: hypothetical protein QM752_04160 [Gammaproteobacteria bacterium]
MVSAIYNASPEYGFQILQYTPAQSEFFLSGSDRYFRITKSIGMKKNLKWPVLHAFMEGIRDELSIEASIHSEMITANESGECLSHYLLFT